jgi:hypothetical protein
MELHGHIYVTRIRHLEMKVTEGTLDTFPAARCILHRGCKLDRRKQKAFLRITRKRRRFNSPLCPSLQEAVSSTLITFTLSLQCTHNTGHNSPEVFTRVWFKNPIISNLQASEAVSTKRRESITSDAASYPRRTEILGT